MSENNPSRRELPQAMAAVLLLDGAPEAQATAWSLSFTSGNPAVKLTAICPSMRVLYMSGFSPEIIDGYGAMDFGQGFLQEPFTKNLATKVRELLDGAMCYSHYSHYRVPNENFVLVELCF